MIPFYISRYQVIDRGWLAEKPWHVVGDAARIIRDKIKTLGDDFVISDDVAIHRSAVVEAHCVLKGPLIISGHCFVAAHAYLRGGVFLDERVIIGPGCEIKSSFLFAGTSIAHFNFIGDSIIGSRVNMEAGAVIANHYNERKDKTISVRINNQVMATGATKFGGLVGDDVKIGANAVLDPGTILPPGFVVNRLEHVAQIPLAS